MPRWARTPSKREKTKQVQHIQKQDLDPVPHTSLELSTHVPGTKDRSAIIGWLPKSWGSIEKTVDIAMMHVKKNEIGPAFFWTDHSAVLMMLPRAFPRPQAAKICRKMGLKSTALSIESADHHWVRISPRQWEDTGWDEEIQSVGIVGHELAEHCAAPWSAAHLEMAKRLDLPFDSGEDDLAGRVEPAIRVVRRN